MNINNEIIEKNEELNKELLNENVLKDNILL